MQDEEKECCEADSTLEEIGEALQQLNNDSAPVSGGITAKFYKTFWRLLKKPLFDCYLESTDRGQLSTSQKRGIITTIYKGNNTRRVDLNNWRQIMLTNVNYKIVTKVLATRLQKIIKYLLNESQSGLIKGRQISL